MKEFSQRLSSCLRERKMSQKTLADRLHITQASVSGFINDKYSPSDRTVVDICEALRINEKWLRTGEGPMEQETPESFTAELAKQYGLNPYAARVVNALGHAAALLSEEQFQALAEIVIREMKKGAPAQDDTVQGERIESVADIVDPEEGDQSTAG